jgi:hypothetical protein
MGEELDVFDAPATDGLGRRTARGGARYYDEPWLPPCHRDPLVGQVGRISSAEVELSNA